MEEFVILVDEQDREIGLLEKMETHRQGLLHRAFSVFIFNSKGELLLQQRALDKYHSPGLWTNTCCSHPRSGETVLAAANRRLKEEMGMATVLEERFSFIYKAKFDNGLIEHELDHVFVGHTDAIPHPDATEVANYRYVSFEALRKEIQIQPQSFTPWLKICLENSNW